MSTSKISLNDKYDIEKHQVLLNGTQALVLQTSIALGALIYCADALVPPTRRKREGRMRLRMTGGPRPLQESV